MSLNKSLGTPKKIYFAAYYCWLTFSQNITNVNIFINIHMYLYFKKTSQQFEIPIRNKHFRERYLFIFDVFAVNSLRISIAGN